MLTIVPMRETADKSVMIRYLAHKMDITHGELAGTMPYEVVAIAKQGFPIGAVMYTNYRTTSIEMACAGEKGWLSRRILRDLFRYPFVQLGCYTVISTVRRSNSFVRKFNEKLGFHTLGVIESGSGKADDTVVYTMTRPQCRWLDPSDHAAVITRAVKPAANGVESHGQKSA